jgi:hypothetical protein
MRLSRPRRFALLLSLGLLAVLSIALPASASAARVLYASGHPIDASRLATFGGHTVVDPGVDGFDGCSDSEWATALSRTDFDILVVGEDAARCGPPLSADTLTNIGNYVRGGKPIIISGAHEDEDDFMNTVFGFSTTNVSDTSDEALTGTLQSGAAAGTLFADGPATLKDPSATELLSGTPGTALYSGPEGAWVFRANVGSGMVTYLAWDLCGEPDDCGNTPSVEDDWYRVLDRAIRINNLFTIDGVGRNKKKGTATITVTVPGPGDLVASGNGALVSSAGRAVISKAVGAGQAQLLIKAQGKKKRKLKRKGKAKLSLAITYTPTGGSANTQSVQVKLKKKLKKKK